jgi:hypothetical protein
MAERKYDKYFVSYERTREDMERGWMGTALSLDSSTVKGSFAYYVGIVSPNNKVVTPEKYVWWKGHPPHTHKEAELLFHIGTNPEDPSDLGGEVVIYMGPELERHVFTKSTVIYIPPNFIHCPWNPVRTWRTWIHVEVHQSPMPSEKRFWQILPKEIVSQMNKDSFPDKGY